MNNQEYILSNSKTIVPKTSVGIVAIGAYLPDTVVANEDFKTFSVPEELDFVNQFGPRERRHAVGETAKEMAVKASKNAIDKYNIDPKSIDLILSTHSCKDLEAIIPPDASYIQTEIGADNATAYNVDCGYNGFLPSMNTAIAYIESGFYDTVLVVAGEKLLDAIDHSNFKALLFGDGAAAVVLKKVEGDKGILSLHAMSKQGEKAAGIKFTGGNGCFTHYDYQVKPYCLVEPESFARDIPFLEHYIPASVEKSLEALNMEPNDMDHYVLGQQFSALEVAWAKNLNVPIEKFHNTLEKYAALKCASVPVSLNNAVENGIVKKGDTVVLGDQGANWYINSMIIKWCI
jgi:3-oxoacyl-[acyl-carrier-protein] synthase-3